MTPRSTIRYALEYSAVRLFVWSARALPTSAGIGAGRFLGAAAARFLGKKRMQLADRNLSLALGQGCSREQRAEILKKLLSLMGEAVIESVVFTREDLEKNIHVTGMEHLHQALARNRGAILLGPHLGMWELASYVLGSHLKDASTIYKPLKNPFVDRFLIEKREKIVHLDLIPSRNALRRVLKQLRQGRMVVMLFDQNAGRDGLPATFFGKTAFTYSAPAAFALKTGCPVVPAYIVKDSGFRKHRLVVEAPFPLIQTGNEESDLLANTQQYNDYMEALVRRYPDQWFGWLHNRWKIPRKFKDDPSIVR